ncbi:MAG TPA: phosphoenolpyruvate--protein phosphotransferase [Terriglobales bacterium]|nr:phosphoenolpyruvate--protein phosphotransferase [Terriglobales bacterium]
MTQKSDISLQFVFDCPVSSGLHARPASHLAEAANDFLSECTLTNLRNGLVANVKSVLGIIAADIRYGDRCAVYISGSDQQIAFEAIRRFVEQTLPRCDVPLANVAVSNRSATPPRPLQSANVPCIFGTSVSRGIGEGKVVLLRRMPLPSSLDAEPGIDPRHELVRIEEAIASVRQRLGEKLKYSLTPTGTAVLQADLAMAGDVFLVEKLKEQVRSGKSAAQAVVQAGEFFIDLLQHSENEYIRQRSADIEEICLQLLEEVHPAAPLSSVARLSEPSVVVAETLAPQQLLELDRQWLKGLVLEHSAATSHAAILARSLGIPTLAGVRNGRLVLTEGREVVVDANRGFVVPQLSSQVRRFYEREQKTLERRKAARASFAGNQAITSDGTRIEVAANVSSGDEITLAFENGADGIGLFRTEMLFLGRDDAPSEEEQFAIYSEAARAAAGRPVIIRTFDIGGDKQVPYLNHRSEENPFLGYRGARLYPEHRDLLQTQLRAILRASAAGQVQIMAPMISSLDEVLHFKSAIAQAKQSLQQNGAPFQPAIKVGIMIEVPSVAFLTGQLCAELDFFSIGTNDLLQYFVAVDRTNPAVASLYSSSHPGFLQFLKQLTESIHRAHKWVGMCGNMAADLRNLPLLLGLGLDEISVPAAEAHEFKRAVSQWRAADCAGILQRAVVCGTAAQVDELLAQKQPRQVEPLLNEHLVLLESTSQSKEEVMQEMVDAFYIANRTQDRDLFEEALWAREAVYSTGLGYGFATPHCKTDAVTSDSICVLRLNEPINWDSVDGERVRMVVLLALRNTDDGTSHMQVFSTLARKLMNDDFRQHLLKFETPRQVTAYLGEELGIDVGLSQTDAQ